MAGEDQQSLLLEHNNNEMHKQQESEDEEEKNVVVEGVPLRSGSVTGFITSAPRSSWSSSIFSCLGNNDEFCSSDLEVCVLGTFAPCLLYASNMERLNPTEGSFANHCLSYTGLLFLGKFLFGCNVLAPCFSYSGRSDFRRKFNMEGNAEYYARSYSCCTGVMESEEGREECESLCDFAAHFLCHRCALCQEGREIRRRIPHPGFFRSYRPMVAPVEQVMAPQM